MSERRIFMTMRQMAWERAKGEIESMLRTYWDEEEKFEEIDKAFRDFVGHVEDHGLHE